MSNTKIVKAIALWYVGMSILLKIYKILTFENFIMPWSFKNGF